MHDKSEYTVKVFLSDEEKSILLRQKAALIRSLCRNKKNDDITFEGYLGLLLDMTIIAATDMQADLVDDLKKAELADKLAEGLNK